MLVVGFLASLAASHSEHAAAQPVTQEAEASASTPGVTAVVLPASTEADLAQPREWVAALQRVLASEGVIAFPSEEARVQFEARVSSPAVALSASDIERWVARSQSAVRYLARADYDRARADLLEAHALASGAAEELNREAERARQVLDTCLYMVRAYVETRDDESAMNQARACRQLVPGAEPSPYRHTPEVREIIARVDRNIAAEPPGQLVVTSSPSGCAVRLNGIAFGSTPFRMDDLAAGEYRLQVECNDVERGRIRRIRVNAGETTVHVDGGFDGAIRSRPGLGLMYEGAQQAHAQAAGHAQVLGEALGVSEVWLVWVVEHGRVRVDRVSARGVSSVWLRADLQQPAAAEAALASAVEHLRAGRSVDLEQPEARAAVGLELPAGVDAEEAEPAEAETADEDSGAERVRDRGQRAGLGVTSGVSAAAFVAATVLHLERRQRGEALAQAFLLSRQAAWIDLRLPSTLLAASGGLLSLATLPVFLPEREGVPVGAWVAGGLGLGLAAASVGTVLRRPSCPNWAADNRRACIRGEELGDRAILLASAGAPLLMVPLLYALRPARVSPEVEVSRSGAWVSLRGVF
ncbi:MAG: PEGA domain-containing protein [Myxococcales bacterium]|nr:PEGA domain-containing protein [Myxococcales bacterium]MCB9628815.1 PEGA domain-containing protein [Sandaracinaceae bacterium]